MSDTPFPLPPPMLDPPHNPSRLILKFMSGLPAFLTYSGVEVRDLTNVDQWRACGNACLLKVGLATEGGNKKEVYNVVAIWLRVIATTHQEEVMPVTMLVQQWFNMYGRWPLTLAFFISCMPSGDKPGADLVPPVLRAGTDVYEAAMNFKAHLTLLARTYYAQPMLPLFWEDNFALRMALNKVLSTNPPISSSLANTASNALAATMTPSAGTNPSALNSSTSAPPAQHDAAVNAMRRLDLSEDDDSLSGDSGSDGASTPRGQTEDEGEGPQQAPAKEAPGDGPASTVGEPSKADAATTSTPVTTITQAS